MKLHQICEIWWLLRVLPDVQAKVSPPVNVHGMGWIINGIMREVDYLPRLNPEVAY